MSEKTILMMSMGRIYVGNPVYETVTEVDQFEREIGERQKSIEIMTEVKDAYEFIPIATLIPDNTGKGFGVLSTFATIKIGTIVSIPDDAVIAELLNDSPYYKEYVKQTTGIDVHGANDMPAAPVRRERGGIH